MVEDQTETPLAGSVTVDGIEGRWARIELPDGSMEDWSLASLPAGVREGDVITLLVDGGDLEMRIDHPATLLRTQQAQQQLDGLNRDSPQGDINL